jgi:hypothetical protein
MSTNAPDMDLGSSFVFATSFVLSALFWESCSDEGTIGVLGILPGTGGAGDMGRALYCWDVEGVTDIEELSKEEEITSYLNRSAKSSSGVGANRSRRRAFCEQEKKFSSESRESRRIAPSKHSLRVIAISNCL